MLFTEFTNQLAEQLSSEQPDMATTNQDIVLIGNDQNIVALMTETMNVDATIGVPVIRPRRDAAAGLFLPNTPERDLMQQYTGGPRGKEMVPYGDWTPTKPALAFEQMDLSSSAVDRVVVDTPTDPKWEQFDGLFVEAPTIVNQILTLLDMLTLTEWDMDTIDSLLYLLKRLKHRMRGDPDFLVIVRTLTKYLKSTKEMFEGADELDFDEDPDIFAFRIQIYAYLDGMSEYAHITRWHERIWQFPSGNYETEDIQNLSRFYFNKQEFWLVAVSIDNFTVIGYNPDTEEFQTIRIGDIQYGDTFSSFNFPEPRDEFEVGQVIVSRFGSTLSNDDIVIREIFPDGTARCTDSGLGKTFVVILFYFTTTGDRV